MYQKFTENGVSFPWHWDVARVQEAFASKTTMELMELFGCNNATSFSRLMRPCFPNKPERMSYSDYAKKLIAEEPKKKVVIKFGRQVEDEYR